VACSGETGVLNTRLAGKIETCNFKDPDADQRMNLIFKPILDKQIVEEQNSFRRLKVWFSGRCRSYDYERFPSTGTSFWPV
jgi:hypothetical protein